jgi:hypothetical protein
MEKRIFSASERIVDLLFALKAFRSGRPDQFPYDAVSLPHS